MHLSPYIVSILLRQDYLLRISSIYTTFVLLVRRKSLFASVTFRNAFTWRNTKKGRWNIALKIAASLLITTTILKKVTTKVKIAAAQKIAQGRLMNILA